MAFLFLAFFCFLFFFVFLSFFPFFSFSLFFLSFFLSLKLRCARGDALMLRRHQQLWNCRTLSNVSTGSVYREIVRR